jgi:hypothetical protein
VFAAAKGNRVLWGGMGRTMLKKVLTWGGLAFVIFFVATKPTNAASVVT